MLRCGTPKKRAGKFPRPPNGLNGAPGRAANFRGALPLLPNFDRAASGRGQNAKLERLNKPKRRGVAK
jgi:hypothetical protein